MALEHRDWRPNWGVLPGEILAETLLERAMTQAELARRMDRPLKTVNEIIKGRASVTAETAIQLEKVLHVPARFWLNLERDYSEWVARSRERVQLKDQSSWLRGFPLKEMRKRGIVGSARPSEDVVRAVLRFFGVSSSSAWERQWKTPAAAFHQSRAFSISAEAVAVWLRLGEIAAAEVECNPFDASKLRAALPQIRALTRSSPLRFVPLLVDLLRSCGVALVFVEELPGTRVMGATRWLSPEKALVQMSLRHRRDDQFWFALFHELGHVLGGARREIYVDLPELGDDPGEIAASEFAARRLVPDSLYAELKGVASITADAVIDMAAQAGIPPGIVVGRLQHDGVIGPQKLNFLKKAIRWLGESENPR